MRMNEKGLSKQVAKYISKLFFDFQTYRTATTMPNNSTDVNAKKEIIIGP